MIKMLSENKIVFDKIIDNAGRQYIYSTKTIKLIDNLIPAGKKILDLGCGSGDIAREIPNKFKDAIGIDISLKSIDIAKHYYKNVFIADMTKRLSFDDNEFDLVIAVSSLHHTPLHVPNIIREVYRVLKPRGEFIIIDHDDRDTHTRLIHSGFLRLVPCKTEKALNIVNIESYAKSLGFKVIKRKEVKLMADQQSLKMPFLERAFKVSLLYICDMFGSKTSGDFYLRLKK